METTSRTGMFIQSRFVKTTSSSRGTMVGRDLQMVRAGSISSA